MKEGVLGVQERQFDTTIDDSGTIRTDLRHREKQKDPSV